MNRRATLSLLAAMAATVAVPVRAQSEPSEDAAPVAAPAFDDDTKNVVAGMNAFSLDLYRQTVTPGANHFVSPASVSIAMGLAYRAAGGTTADELRRILHYPLPPAEQLRAAAPILRSLNFASGGRELATANAIWVDNSVVLRPDYVADTQGLAGAIVSQTDFRNAPDPSRIAINDWVSERTRGRIVNLLAPIHVTENTRSVLVNAMYWKANWANPFAAGTTRDEPFRGADGQTVAAPLMHQRESFRSVERNGVKAILLPYAGGELEMAVFLPNSAKGLPHFEERLTAAALDDWFARLAAAPWRDTVLTLPKMHLSWEDDLVPTFKAMGMETAFGLDADFTAIATPSDKGVLAIGAVVHKTYLDVDEAGSEAAAATAVVDFMVTGARMGPPPPPPFVFRADHPFLFVLRDRRTGVICFMGRFASGETGA